VREAGRSSEYETARKACFRLQHLYLWAIERVTTKTHEVNTCKRSRIMENFTHPLDMWSLSSREGSSKRDIDHDSGEVRV
jgi:hypothetical protein